MVELAGIEIAIAAINIMIVLSALVIAAGKIFGSKKLELTGLKELFHSIINGAIVGGFAIISDAITQSASSIFQSTCSEGSPVSDELMCVVSSVQSGLSDFSQVLLSLGNAVGYYSKLGLNLGSVSITPFQGLEVPLEVLKWQSVWINLLSSAYSFEHSLLSFISANSIAVFLTLGVIFRTFFITRKFGNFLIALSVALYIVYPALSLVASSPADEIANITAQANQTVSSDKFSLLPVSDLNSNSSLAYKLDNISAEGLSSDVSDVLSYSEKVSSKATFLMVWHLAAFIIALLFAAAASRASADYSIIEVI